MINGPDAITKIHKIYRVEMFILSACYFLRIDGLAQDCSNSIANALDHHAVFHQAIDMIHIVEN